VLPEIRRDLALSATSAGLTTTGPILCLSLFGMLAPTFARRYGLDRSVFGLQRQQKTGVFLDSAGDFWEFSANLNIGLQRLMATRKACVWRAFLIQRRKFSETRNALAGDAVLIAPVSGQIPC
jgi:hypothetical protein